jgi:hypothetical protein
MAYPIPVAPPVIKTVFPEVFTRILPQQFSEFVISSKAVFSSK